MILFRTMNDQEADDTLKYNTLSWNSKHKWFGTLDFISTRVHDGSFNNSRHKPHRYNRLLQFTFDDDTTQHFRKCGRYEWMISRHDANKLRYNIEEITSLQLPT